MKKNNTFLVIFMFLTQLMWSQSGEKWLSGKIIADSTSIENVNITNTRNEKFAVSNKEGIFKILVKSGDVLVLSAVNLLSRRITLTEENLQSEMLQLKMNPKITQIKEVTVNEHSNVNSENLGITPHGQKKYTPAERKLYTATTGILDPLLNKISGRTAMLKKEVAVERKEKLLLRLDGLYENKYYTEVLKIPQDYIKGFQYYLIEDPDYVNALLAKNKTMTMFLIKRLAVNYNEIIGKQGAIPD